MAAPVNDWVIERKFVEREAGPRILSPGADTVVWGSKREIEEREAWGHKNPGVVEREAIRWPKIDVEEREARADPLRRVVEREAEIEEREAESRALSGGLKPDVIHIH